MCKPIDERVDISGLTGELIHKEFARINTSFEFYLDFGLKVVAFFYAAVGGVLSIYFGVSDKLNNAVIVLLGIPILMSSVLGYYFFHAAHLWQKHMAYIHQLAEELKIKRPPNVEFLEKLLKIFGALFFITSAALLLLLVSVLIKLWA